LSPNLQKNVQKLLPCNILKSELQFSNPLRYASAKNECNISQVY